MVKAVEQYRNVDNLISCIQEVDSNTGMPLCNARCCPVMSAGRQDPRIYWRCLLLTEQEPYLYLAQSSEGACQGTGSTIHLPSPTLDRRQII